MQGAPECLAKNQIRISGKDLLGVSLSFYVHVSCLVNPQINEEYDLKLTKITKTGGKNLFFLGQKNES